MSLVVGDIHGNYPKAKCFLEYKPEEEHIFVGDYTDSFVATDDQIIQTAKMIFDSNAIVLAGNHDIQYFSNSTASLRCTGYRDNYSFVHLMQAYKDRIKASYIANDYIITHGGVLKALSKDIDDIEYLNYWINLEFEHWKNAVIIPETLSTIFNIGRCRGGWHQYSGIFWADYRSEKHDIKFNQVFGHSHSSSAKDISVGKQEFRKHHICVDCPQFVCFNTKTQAFEDFFPEEMDNYQSRYMLEKTY